MTNEILIRDRDGEINEHTNVVYSELCTRARDNCGGVAIQYGDGETQFVPEATIVGVYPESEQRGFTHKFEELVD